MKLETMKNLLGNKYKFTSDYENDEIRKAVNENDENIYGEVPYVLEAGCVDIEVEILGEEDEPMYGCYNICVKIDEVNWRTFDSLPEIVDFNVPDMEAEMFRLLDEYVSANNLSYTEPNGKQFTEMMRKFGTPTDSQTQENTVTKMSAAKQSEFKLKILENYESYIDKWLTLTPSQLIEQAEEIALTKQVCEALLLTDEGYMNDAEYLMRFENPLEIIYDECSSVKMMDVSDAIGYAIERITSNQDIDNDYSLDENYTLPDSLQGIEL